MAKIKAQIEHQSGIPLGGLGTGTVEIRPDGYFHEWQIFNLGRWAPQQPECCKQGPGPNMPPGSLAFYLRTEQAGRGTGLLSAGSGFAPISTTCIRSRGARAPRRSSSMGASPSRGSATSTATCP